MKFKYMQIKKNDPIPLHYQVAESIRRAIDSGVLKENDPLPTESQLCEAYEISRTVVRQAYSNLINEGLIERYKRKGTFVSSSGIKGSFFKEISNFENEMKRSGLTASTKVLNLEIITDHTRAFKKLQLESGQACLHLTRLRFGDDLPIVLVETFIPVSLFPEIQNHDFVHASLYDVFENEYNCFIKKVERSIQARIIDDAAANLLNVRLNTAVHLVESVAFNLKDERIEYSTAIYPGERNKFDLVIYK